MQFPSREYKGTTFLRNVVLAHFTFSYPIAFGCFWYGISVCGRWFSVIFVVRGSQNSKKWPT